MTDWEPATEAEKAMREALRANDQELYFRILSRAELLLPVSPEALTGQGPAGWGTWTTGGRTHVLAFTSPAALRACLGDGAAASRRTAYADLAAEWPNHEWWLAVNPGLPIEGYLPAWFVSQLSRGDVRLPGRTLGARARLQRVEMAAQARATVAAQGRDAAQQPPSQRTAAAPGQAGPRTPSRPVNPLAPPYGRSAGAGEPSGGSGAQRGSAATGADGPADGRAAPAAADPAPTASAWLTARRRSPAAEPAPVEPATGSTAQGWPADRPPPSVAPASFFEPAANRKRSARTLGEEAVPPTRFAGGQPFPRRRPAAGPLGEQPTQAFRASAPAESPTVAFSAGSPAESPTVAFSAGSPAESPTVAFPSGAAAESPTVAFSAGSAAGAQPQTRAFPPAGSAVAKSPSAAPGPAVAPGQPTWPGEPPRAAPDAEATQALRTGRSAEPPTQPFGALGAAEDATRAFAVGGVGAHGDLPRRRPGLHPAQAVPQTRAGAGDGEPTRPLALGGDKPEERLSSHAEPVSGPPAPRRSSSPIIIEGTVIESRDLPATGSASSAGSVTPAVSAGSAAPAGQVAHAEPARQVGKAAPTGPAEPAGHEGPEEDLFRPAKPVSPGQAEEATATEQSGDAPVEDLFRPAASAPDASSAGPEPASESVPVPEFHPANDVEADLLAAVSAGSTDNFLSTLLLAWVLLPIAPDSASGSRPGDPGFVWRTEQLDDATYVVVYTSPERMADHLDEPVETMRVKFVRLIRRWPDAAWSFAVNPNTPVGAKLPGEQIVALANWAAEVGLGDDSASEPEPTPAAMGPATGARSAPPPVDPNRPIVMQKAIAPSQLSYYLERGYDRVSGFVHRASELAHLNTPAQLHDALGLNFPGSPFERDAEEIYVLRWPAYRPSLYRIPYGGQNEAAMRAMEGWVIERPPFRGNGFAPGESSDVVAEFKVDSARLPHGAQLVRISADGTEQTVAVLDTDALTWRRVGAS